MKLSNSVALDYSSVVKLVEVLTSAITEMSPTDGYVYINQSAFADDTRIAICTNTNFKEKVISL